MIKYKFKPEVKALLVKAGWHESRQIDVKAVEADLTENGLPILEIVMAFLCSFDGLKIEFVNPRNGMPDNMNLNVHRAMELEVVERLTEDYEPRLGCIKCCFIGTAYREHFILFMDEKGAVYGAYDDFLVKIADSGEEAIEAIILRFGFKEIT